MDNARNWWQTAEFDFIRIPKELFRNPYYAALSPESRLLYGFLLDRASLSWSKGEHWRTPEGDPFVIFSLAEIQQRLNCADKKATRLLKALVDHNLIRLSRPKRDGPYHIVVLPFIQSKERLGNRQNNGCADVVLTAPESSKQRHNNTEPNNTERNNTELITQLEREIHSQIEYDILLSDIPKLQLDSVVEVMVQVLSSRAKTITVGGIPMDAGLVRQTIRSAGSMRIQYIFDHMQTLTDPIRSHRAYYLARLMDSAAAVDSFYETFCTLDWD